MYLNKLSTYVDQILHFSFFGWLGFFCFVLFLWYWDLNSGPTP
jgi:hypothetical protein